MIPIGNLIIELDCLIAFGCGVIILYLFCIERFDQPANIGGSIVQTLVPRTVSSAFEYRKTFALYVVVLFFLYTGLSLVGPSLYAAAEVNNIAGFSEQNLVDSIEDAQNRPALIVPAWVPLAILLLLTGGATHFRQLNQIELFARRLSHRLIGIPHDIEQLVQDVRERKINFDYLEERDLNFLFKSFEFDKNYSLTSLTALQSIMKDNDPLRRWMRLHFLSHVIETRDVAGSLNKIIRQDYNHVWRQIQNKVTSLRSDRERLKLLLCRTEILDESDANRRVSLIEDIDEALSDLHVLIAISIYPIRKKPSEVQKIVECLKIDHTPIEDRNILNRVLFALIVLFIGVLLSVYLTRGNPVEALEWATAAFALHGAAALAAWKVRYKYLKNQRWIPLNFRNYVVPTLQYVRVCVSGYICGFIALSIWYIVIFWLSEGVIPNVSSDLIWIPAYSVVAVMTSFWVAYGVDLLQRSTVSMRRRIFQVVAQSVSTGGVAIFVTISLQSLAGKPDEAALYLAWTIGLITAIAAAILGFITLFLSGDNSSRRRMSVSLDNGVGI